MVDPLTAAAIAAMAPVLKDLATDILKDSAKEEAKGWQGDIGAEMMVLQEL